MAQNQGNIWHFGEGAGLDFGSGSPVVITGGQTTNASSHSEGTAVIADSSGQLLFYSNGETIWDGNHQVMPNGSGLLGHSSSTHAAFILPQPGSTRFYYVFTADGFFENNLQNGLRYNVVDMCLNEGDGDVLVGQKNVLLMDTIAEKITAVRHSNGQDYWVITHKFFSDEFCAFRLTQNGIMDTVISAIGSAHVGNVAGAIGQLKASPDGTKLAIAAGNGNNLTELFDFDASTGIVSNFIDLPRHVADSRGYGVSFSADNSKLYFGLGSISPAESYIVQFDLTAGGGHPDSIRASAYDVTVTPFTLSPAQGLQLGVDGKIYKINYTSAGNLDVINNPNLAGAACNFSANAISLGGATGSYTLPSFLDSYDYPNTGVCDQTSINEILSGGTLSAYPNPAGNQITLSFAEPVSLSGPVIICDAVGREVKRILPTQETCTELFLNLSGLPAALYLIRVETEGGLRTVKVIHE